jgi:hypothetical protein
LRANNDFTGSDTRLYASINTSSYDPVNALIFNQADHWESDSDGPCPNGQEHFHAYAERKYH